MRIFFLIVLVTSSFVSTASGSPRELAAYGIAERSFETTFPPNQRVFLQEVLITAGYLNAVPNEDFNSRVFLAIQRLQGENGLLPTGVLDKATLTRLFSIATPMFEMWGFQKIVHPQRGIALWAPQGLQGLMRTTNEFGLHYFDNQGRLVLDFTTVPNVSLAANYAALVNANLKEGALIHYKVIKDGWYVISSSTPDGGDHYLRYHQDGQNVTGFSLSWFNDKGNISGERIAVLMSASLWSSMTGAPFVDLPGSSNGRHNPAQTAAAPQAGMPPPPKPSAGSFSSGTAFFVAGDGTLVTNAHVVSDCSLIQVKSVDGSIDSARVVARDAVNDLAIIRIDKHVQKYAGLRIGARLGESVAAFGFPHSDLLATSGNFTLGNITALSGIGDDSRFVQMSAPVQAGNSGGPLLDQNGNLVGVVTSKLNALKVALSDGDLPQNVNFAVKAATLATFLDSNRVTYQVGADGKPLEPADLADKAREISAYVLCK